MSVKLPKSVIDGLRIGLQLHKSGKGGRGLVDETLRMARQGVRTGQWPEWKVVKASAWFARHVADRRRMTTPRSWNRPPNYSPAYVAWALWGDDGKGAGRRWIDKKAKELKAQGVKASPRKNPPRENPPPGWVFLPSGEDEVYILRSPIASAFVERSRRGWDWFIIGVSDPRHQVAVEGSTTRRVEAFRQAQDALMIFDPVMVSAIEEEEKRAARIGGKQPMSKDFLDFFRVYSLPRANPSRTQPYKYGVPAKYLEGLPDKVARARAEEIIMRRKAGVKTSKPLPGDRAARSKGMKGSKWTRMYKQKYGADSGTTRAAVARDTGIPVAIINEVYKRGVGASRTSGHRPGANDSSWALARVHAFVMKVLHKKGPINQDPDLARKVMARKNPVLKSPGVSDAEVRRLGESYLKGRDILSTRRGKDMARAAAEKVHSEFEKVLKKVKVIFTERDPYPDFEALRADVRNNNRMYIYTGHSVTPLWDEQTNWKARAVHDYDHVKEGAGFGLHGEFMAFRASAKRAPQLSDLYMSEIPLQAAAYHLKGSFPDGPQKVVPINPELKRLVNRLGMRQNPSKRRNRNRMANLALDAQTLGKFMPPEDVAMHLGASYQGDAPIEEVVLASISSIGRKKSRNNPPFKTPPYMRRCVVHLVEDGHDLSAAFAICNASMQDAGYLSSGEGKLTQRELSSGKRKRKIDSGEKDQKWFDREYEKILKGR